MRAGELWWKLAFALVTYQNLLEVNDNAGCDVV